MSITIQTGFDGSCPHSPKGVRRDRRGRFILFPGVRRGPGLGEEVPGKGSRLSTRLLNSGKKEKLVSLVVDWDTPDRVEHHDLGYIRHERESDWTMVPGRRDGVRGGGPEAGCVVFGGILAGDAERAVASGESLPA